MSPLQPAERAGIREWAGLAVLALPCLLVSMDSHVLNLAIPRLTAELHPTNAELLWIADGYGFLVAGSLLTMGALGDRIGRRRVLLAGAAAFGLASMLAAFATTTAMLILARGLLGVAGATLMPSTLSLIRALFADPGQRRVAYGVWTASFALGGVIAPLVAGLLLRQFWWGSVFLVAVPPMLLLLALGPVLLPETRDPEARRVDAASAALSLAAVLGAVYALKSMVQSGAGPVNGLAAVAGIAAGAAFVRRQRRPGAAWIDFALFRRRAFAVPLAANAISFFVLYGTSLFFVQYLQLVLGLSPLRAGLYTIPSALGYLAGSALAPVAGARLRPAGMLASSLGLTVCGLGILARLGAGSSPAVAVAGTVIFAIGLAPVYVLATEMTLSAAPPERSGAVSGVLESSAELGGALGVAILGSIGGAIYRGAMGASPPLALPAGVWDDARRTLGGAIAAAPGLPEPLAGALTGSAQQAFMVAFRAVHVAGAGLMAALAVGAALALRRVARD